MRVQEGSLKTATNGAFLHSLNDSQSIAPPMLISRSHPELMRADINRRHEVYTALLELLHLSGRHANNLLHRGLSDLTIARNLYASLPALASSIENICCQLSSSHNLTAVPGFYKDQDYCWQFRANRSGFLIPVRNAHGQIEACQIRQDSERRYIWFSSRDMNGGASSGAPIHFSNSWYARETGYAIVTEGALKADIISERLDRTVIALAGVNSFSINIGPLLRKQIPELKKMTIAFDSDWKTNRQVRSALTNLIKALKEHFDVKVWDWKDAKGLDDLLLKNEVVK
jgi:hypothetical protein